MKRYCRLFILAVIVVVGIGYAPIVSGETLLRIATPGALTGALPIYLGGKKGIFSKYGLAVEVIATRNEQMNMQALMSDSVQFLTSSSTGLFYLGKQGLDAVGLASWNNSSPYKSL
jgi:ABC-type nitrate/sulfonate/bicarbonate transport system substrate-binding protein